MRLTRAAPARPTSSRTWPIVRCSAPFTAARSGSGAFARLRGVLRRFATMADFLTLFRAGFFFAICLSLVSRTADARPRARGRPSSPDAARAARRSGSTGIMTLRNANSLRADKIGTARMIAQPRKSFMRSAYGINNTFPVVFRPSSAWCALAASFSGNSNSIRRPSLPAAIQPKRSLERCCSSARVAM